ncbi:MAG TPA: hypothetical protein VG889_15160 [Rhizomicrobium sp.]|nr:hypothetical protein [Rhizomicrobium sp.]
MQKIFVVVALGAAVTLAACGKKDEKTVYSDGQNTVSTNESGDHTTITGANGEKMEFGAGSSAKMPAFAPAYPGAKVTASFTANTGKGESGSVQLLTSASPADVIAFYKQKTAAAGMAQQAMAEMGTTTIYSAADDKSKQAVSISATKGSDGTTVQVTWGPK